MLIIYYLFLANNEATAIQRDDTIPLNLIVCNESSSAPNSSGLVISKLVG